MTIESPPDLPCETRDDEVILRAIGRRDFTSSSRTKLNYSAFKPKAGCSLVSMMRLDAGVKFCKYRAKKVKGDDYTGMTASHASSYRKLGLEIIDAQDEFAGHVNIDIGDPPLPQGDPAAPERNKEVNDLCRAILAASKYHEDNEPDSEEWGGAEIK